VLRAEKLDFLQINYALDDRQPRERLLPLAAERGVAVIVNMPFGGGGLLRGLLGKPLPGWAGEIGCTSWAQVLLKFVLSQPAVTCAIPGTRRRTTWRTTSGPASACCRRRVLDRQGRDDRPLKRGRRGGERPDRLRRSARRRARGQADDELAAATACASSSRRRCRRAPRRAHAPRARPMPSPDSSSGTWVSIANRSKMPASTSGAIPAPSSATLTTTWWPSNRVVQRHRAARRRTAARRC
jgi:hypothetical protein